MTIYSGASILGGETTIGDHAVVGGNALPDGFSGGGYSGGDPHAGADLPGAQAPGEVRCPQPDGVQHRPAGILFRLFGASMSHCLPSEGAFLIAVLFSVSDSLLFASGRQLSFNSPFCVKNVPPTKEPFETGGFKTSFPLKSFIRYGT